MLKIYDDHVRYSTDLCDGVNTVYSNPFAIKERKGITPIITIFDINYKYFNTIITYLTNGDVKLSPPPPKDGIVYFIY